MVALGFKVDEKGLKNFNAGVEQATKGVIRLVSTIQGAALSVGAGVSAFASKLERLYFVSQRTGAAATSLKAFEYAARNLGVSSEAAFGTVENLARFLRNNPAGEGYLATIGVQTRDANGQLRDTVDILADVGKELAQKPTWLANQYGQILGIDENLLLANRGAKGGYKAGTENLEGMTVAEVMRAQQEGQFNAAGRYQIIKTTLADAVKKLGLTGSEKFDRGLQDRIFSEYLVGSKRSAIKDYLTGASDNIVAAMQAAAREWASVADPATGKSFYDGVGNNRASISVEQLEQALRNTRAAMTATPTVYAQRAPGGNSVQLEQRTEINVYGVNDAAAAGREVSREQGRLNGDLVRNLQGAVS
ncbi:putative bacteriophage protein [Cupriavidus gilardii CR3]|nr:putative bacteriophage protein [Cupriavidus gilardii CR3]